MAIRYESKIYYFYEMAEASVIVNSGTSGRPRRAKSFEDIENQVDRLTMRAIRQYLPSDRQPTPEESARFNQMDSRIEGIGRRYLNNISSTRTFRNARRRFDREGYDLDFRESEAQRGRDNYALMYQTPYSQSIYMRNRRRGRNA